MRRRPASLDRALANLARTLQASEIASRFLRYNLKPAKQNKKMNPYGFFFVLGLAGPAGFEPANDGTKTRCLTTWRRPNAPYILP